MSSLDTGNVLGIFAILVSIGGVIYTAVNHKRFRLKCCGKDLDVSVDVEDTHQTVTTQTQPQTQLNTKSIAQDLKSKADMENETKHEEEDTEKDEDEEDEDTKEKHYINTPAAFFNDLDMHGGNSCATMTWSLRIDGKFNQKFKEQLGIDKLDTY